MDYAIAFTRHYARLVYLVRREPGKVDQQRAALRAAVTACTKGPVHLAVREMLLMANGEPFAGTFVETQDLATRMSRHGVRQIQVATGASAEDLFSAARVLAGQPQQADGGLGALRLLRELKARGVRFDVDADARALRSVRTPLRMAAVVARAEAEVAELAVALEILEPDATHDVEPEVTYADTHVVGAPRRDSKASSPDDGFSRSLISWTSPDTRTNGVAALIAAGDVAALFAAFDAADTLALKAQMLDDIAGLAERAARDGRSSIVGDVLAGVSARESVARSSEAKKALGLTWRRLARQHVLREVAALLLSRKSGPTDDYEAVLIRAGEEGAEALIDRLAEATTAEERRTCYDTLLRIGVGVSSLLHMLGDPRWFVVRNAADLLGEMRAEEAEQPLVDHVRHVDERVRRAACTALMRIGTPGAQHALREALRDTAPEVRQVVVSALTEQAHDAHVATTLVSAFESEEDEDVQIALITALGRAATSDAVLRLIAVAEPGGRIFNKKSTSLRVAAVHALGEVGSAAARASLTALTDDRERDVKEAAVRARSRA